ncbi:MAG: menaquinone biosynthesis protein [candidate division FCPU426 bacterium]
MILANIPYLNTTPYFHFLDKAWLDQQTLISSIPRALGDMARDGRLDAAIFSLVDAEGLVASGRYEFLGNLGIAGRGPIQSILLFGVRDPAALEGKSIAVTSHTATSSRLMEIWLKEKVGIKAWTRVAPGEPASATLLIGDEALERALHLQPGEPEPIDLCEAWTAWTGFPFVFARWAVRRDLPEPEKKALREALSHSLDASLADLEKVAEKQAGIFEKAMIQAYLKGITYHLGPEEEKGAALFKEKLLRL